MAVVGFLNSLVELRSTLSLHSNGYRHTDMNGLEFRLRMTNENSDEPGRGQEDGLANWIVESPAVGRRFHSSPASLFLREEDVRI